MSHCMSHCTCSKNDWKRIGPLVVESDWYALVREMAEAPPIHELWMMSGVVKGEM